MKKHKVISIVTLLLIALLSTNFSIHNSDRGPHGGDVIEANDGYFIEVVYGYKARYFYLLDYDGHSTIYDQNLSGELTVTMKDGSIEKHKLTLSKDFDELGMKFIGKKKRRKFFVQIEYKGKLIKTEF